MYYATRSVRRTFGENMELDGYETYKWQAITSVPKKYTCQDLLWEENFRGSILVSDDLP